MPQRKYKQLVLKKRPGPQDLVSFDNFEVKHAELPDDLLEGQILAKVTYLSCDPTERLWLSPELSYMPPINEGDVMRCLGLARVEKSKNANFKAGDRIYGFLGWTEYVVGNPTLHCWHKIEDHNLSDEACLGPCGMTGQAAYFGLFEVAKIKPGDTVLISAAAGAVGSIVTQLAKMGGCHVIGTVSGDHQVKQLKEKYKADEALDYKAEKDLSKRIHELAGKEGYNVVWDNVGGTFLEDALDNIALGGKVIICGGMSQYLEKEKCGPRNYLNLLKKRASMTSFLVFDYWKDKLPEAMHRLGCWVHQGKLQFETDVQEGPLEKAPDILNRLFKGENRGKQVHRLLHEMA